MPGVPRPDAAPPSAVPPVAVPPVAVPPAAVPAKSAVSQKTLLGMTSPFVSGVPKPLHGKEAPAEAAAERAPPSASAAGAGPLAAPGPRSPGVRPGVGAKGTMVGMAPPPGVSADAPRPEPKRTMMGMTAPAVVTPAREELARKAAAALASGGAAAEPPATVEPPPAAAPPLVSPPRAVLPEQKIAPKSARTMLGIAGGAPAPVAVEPSRSSSVPPSTRSFTQPNDELPRRSSKRPPSVLRPLLAALAGALVVLAIGVALWQLFGGTNIAVRVVQSDVGEALEVSVPDAAPGAKVRFLGVEQDLRGGVAQFPLAADALALGDNELAIGLVRGGEVESAQVRLHVAYRARVDATALSREPPALDVVIEALPGSKVTLDGKPLPLDARGRGVRSYPIGAQSGSKLAFEARYRIEPQEGAPTEGTLKASLPVTSVQIDRPGPNVTSDQASIEVAGEVETGAEITIDGQRVKVNGNRFLHRVKLPTTGQYTVRVLARSAGKAPRSLELSVTRVADLELAAAGFEADPALTYARIAQNPVIYRDQKVSFDGRVYNVEVKAGTSHLQLLVRDCPGSQRCPLWVELPQATDVTNDTWVRVLGTVAGEQQFRSERGQVHTVPSVRAQFVLKLAR